MLRFWIFAVLLSCVSKTVIADPHFNGKDSFEILQRQNERLGQLENIIKRLLKDNDELKKKQQQDIAVLTKTLEEQQIIISNLELKMEILEEKETKSSSNETYTRKDSRLDIISSDSFSQYESDREIKIRRDTELQKEEQIRRSRLLEGNIQPTSQPTTVAFYAYMSKAEAIAPHHTLIFDHVETNLGGGYNQHTGAFIVPVTGVYLLTYTAFPYTHPSYSSVELAVNSAARGAIFVDSSSVDDDYTGCTGNVILVLNQGDACIVRIHPTYQSIGKINSNNLMRTSFSGILISQ